MIANMRKVPFTAVMEAVIARKVKVIGNMTEPVGYTRRYVWCVDGRWWSFWLKARPGVPIAQSNPDEIELVEVELGWTPVLGELWEAAKEASGG